MIRILALAMLIPIAACVPPERYTWGGYEDALYISYRDVSKQEAYVEVLAKTVARGEADGKVAPGIHAEYGYMLLTLGRKPEAIAEFDAEKRRWPESRVLMDRMIGLANGRGNVAPAVGKTGA